MNRQNEILNHCKYGHDSLHLAATTAPHLSKDPDYEIREWSKLLTIRSHKHAGNLIKTTTIIKREGNFQNHESPRHGKA